MKKDEPSKDRMMDALLRENARGGDDEEFLTHLEEAIDAAGEGGEVEKAARGSAAPWGWGLAAAACIGGVVGYQVFFGEESERRADRAMASGAAADTREMGKRQSSNPSGPQLAGNPGDPAQTAVPAEPRADQASARVDDALDRLKYSLATNFDETAEADPAREAKKPEGPSSSEANVLASVLPSPTAVPVPGNGKPNDGPVSFGNDIGGGWSGGGDGAGGGFGNIRKQVPGARQDNYDRVTERRRRETVLRGAEIARAKTELAAIEQDFRKYDGRTPKLSGKELALLHRRDLLRKRIADAEHPRDAVPVPADNERYGQLVDQPWQTPWQTPLSTFSVDVDTASYTNIRRLLRSGAAIPRDAVRIEECINYFDYSYPKPQGDGPFAVHVNMASCPWKAEHHLVKIGLKGREVDSNTRPPSNLVFLIDVSGSMNQANKLPLLVESMKILVEELDERDTVGIVVYAGSAGTILEPTKVVGNGRTEILSALDHLRAGGSTAGAAGLRGAYQLAAKHYRKGGVNRVILATDGDFNVGTSSNGELVDLVKEKAKSGVSLSVLGFGTGNINDSMLEAITNDGNGNYFYIDSQREGRKVFLQNLSGTLVTIAKHVKIQVEFNPGKVAAYRLIGYANRILPPEAFNDDKVVAGDIGAGHTVTALYEIVPTGVEPPKVGGVDGLKYQKPAKLAPVDSPEWMTVKLRYKAPDGDESSLLEVPVKDDKPIDWTTASSDFQMAAAVALFGEKLRGSDKIDDAAWELVQALARKGATEDRHGHRAEFLELVSLAGRLPEVPDPAPEPADPIPAVEAPVAR